MARVSLGRLATGPITGLELGVTSMVPAQHAPGRLHDDEIILMSVGGMPVEDVAWGAVVYRKALEQGVGVKLNLWGNLVLS